MTAMFHSPWYLTLLLLVPLLVWRLHSYNTQQAVPFSSIDAVATLPLSWRQRIAWVPRALSVVALVLLIIAVARPREGREQAFIESEGIAIEMVVDRSGSMQALDFKIDGQHVNRLAAIKHVASKFVLGDEAARRLSLASEQLTGRTSDLIGLIAFAGYADAITPPTLDHHFLVDQLDSIRIVPRGREDGTAIGDAISLAVEKLNRLEGRQEQEIKSKVIILLTDGENTAGEFEPIQAAELAQRMGVRVYTIGVGTRGKAPMPFRNRITGQPVMMDVFIDEETLQKIAELTDGKYFRATDLESLESIYTEIDQLEKTKVETQQFMDYRELAIQPAHVGVVSIPPPVTLALVCLATQLILSQTVLRELSS